LACLSEASFQTPGSFEARRASASGGQVNGCALFGSFLYANKEMNINMSESFKVSVGYVKSNFDYKNSRLWQEIFSKSNLFMNT